MKKRGLIASNASEFAVRPRSNNLKFQESPDLLGKSDNFLKKGNQQKFKKLIEKEEGEQIESRSDVRKTERGKEYPLRSLTERKMNSDGDTTDSQPFRWVCRSSKEPCKLVCNFMAPPSMPYDFSHYTGINCFTFYLTLLKFLSFKGLIFVEDHFTAEQSHPTRCDVYYLLSELEYQ